MSQYAFSLPSTPQFSEDNFQLSACNEEAYKWITGWPSWSALYLFGPAGSGKSHLGHIWAKRADAEIFSAGEVLPTPDRLGCHALIEDIEKSENERRLLHLINAAREANASLLLTSRVPAKQLPFTLPDLTSRLLAMPAASIDSPDDAALAGAMKKQFADRQIRVSDEVIAYLLPRIERDFARAAEIVERLDKSALEEKRSLTIPFLKQVLAG